MKTGGKWFFLLVMSAIWLTMSLSFGGVANWFLVGVFGLLTISALLFPLLTLIQVEVSHTLSAKCVVSGNDIFVSVDVKQRSLLPLPWLIIKETWQHDGGGGDLEFQQLIFPWFHSRMNVSYVLNGLHRGTYRLIRTELIAGDFLGFTVRKRSLVQKKTCLITPKPWLGQWNGALSAGTEGRRFQHVTMPTHNLIRSGVREYTNGDPLNRIHWKATARTGKLHTKEEGNSQTDKILLLLDGGMAKGSDEKYETYKRTGFPSKKEPVKRLDYLFEQRVELAAGILQETRYVGTEVRFATNAIQGEATGAYFSMPSTMDWNVCNEGLSHLQVGAGMSFADLLVKESSHIHTQISLICIVSTLDENIVEALHRWIRRKRSIKLYVVQDSIQTLYYIERLENLGCQVVLLEPRNPYMNTQQTPTLGGAADVRIS
ncbi:DUF58 domain-containing protein [Paenibacillus sp. KN14-4R]|uniref:DUF58 domain-containing protein n=1 Tax=Paenibacillus sp. KN14-4R TaxID=3445773 RepID=UPI003F9EE738